MDHSQDIPEIHPLERTRSFDEEPKQPTNIPNVIEHALQKLDTTATKAAATTKAKTTTELTKDDVKYLFSGAPHFMLEKGRHNHWYPHVLFPWDTSLPIQDLWDREQLRHESFTLSTLHAHLPIPTTVTTKTDSSGDPSVWQGWQYEEGVKRSTYDLGIFEVPNMLSVNGKEPGAIGFRHFLELATADEVRYKRAIPTQGGGGDALDSHLLSNMPLTEAFAALNHLRDSYALCNHETIVLDRHKLLCEGPAAWKRIGVRDVPVRDIVERLEYLSNFRLKAIKQLPTDESGHKKIITILDKESLETLHKNLYTKLLFPPPHGWIHQHEDLKGQIEVLTRVLAVKGAWIDMSLPEWRLRVGQILWEKPPHTDGDCMDCLKDENGKSEENKKVKSPLSLNTGLERKWLLIQLLLAGELLMRLDAIVQVAVLEHSKVISVTAQDMRELDKLRHGKVNWDILFFQRASDSLIFKFTPPGTPSAATLSEQSHQKNETPSQSETKQHGFRSRIGSISQHFPLHHASSIRAGKENASHEQSSCESNWDSVIVLPRRPERQLKGLAVFAEKIGWPGHETLEARIRSNLLQHNADTTQVLTSDSVSAVYSTPVTSGPTSRTIPKKGTYCRSPSHRYVTLHKPESTADDIKGAGGWLSRSWLAGLVMPGESIHQLLMATILENDPTTIQTLGTVANLYGGLSYGNESTWWSTKCIVGRVLAALPGSKVCMGWVRVNTLPEIEEDKKPIQVKNTWISVEGVQESLQKNTRIRHGIKMATESNPLGKGRVASDTFTIPVDEEDDEKRPQFDVKFDKLILSRQETRQETLVDCCGAEAIKRIFTADRASVLFQLTTSDSTTITFPLKYNVAFISSYTCQPPRGSVTHHTPHHDDNSDTHEHDDQLLQHMHLPGHPLHKTYKYKYVALKDLRSDTVPPIIVFPSNKESSPSASNTHLNAKHNEKHTCDHAHKQDEKEEENLEPIWILDARSSTRDKAVFARAWCAAVGVNALIGRVGRTCLACCVREARAIGVGVVIRV
jgi:hypothetical protein